MKTSTETTTFTDDVISSSNKEEYEAMLPMITAITEEQITPRTIPPLVVVGESETLLRRVLRDRNELIKAGLPPETIEQLRLAAGALRYAESQLNKNRVDRVQWREEYEKAVSLFNQLLRGCFFALRNNPSALARLRAATKGNSAQHRVQHLANLSVIGREYREELVAIGFDMELLDTAATLSARLGDFLGMKNAEMDGDNELMKIRNQAYTCCKNLMTGIRDYGKYVFYNDKKRYRGYTSVYTRNRKRKKTADIVAPATEPADLPAPAPVAAAA